MPRARFIVRGFVQGVNFRATAASEARRQGITGRVWNRDDGAVALGGQTAREGDSVLFR